MGFFNKPFKAIRSSLGGAGGAVLGNMLLPGVGAIAGGALGQGVQNASRGKSLGQGVIKGGLIGGGFPLTGSLIGGKFGKKRQSHPSEGAMIPRSKQSEKSSQLLSNELMTENLRNRLYADQLGLNNSNYPIYRGETEAPMSELTRKAQALRGERASKPAPYSKKVESFMKKEGTGFSPDQTRALLDMLAQNGPDQNQMFGRLEKQFGRNYGYEPERAGRVQDKLGKDSHRAQENAAANFKNLNREFADVENRRNMDVARTFHDAGEQKGIRKNALINQLEDFGNQEHALRNLQNRARKDAFDEAVQAPQRKLVTATRALNTLGPEEDHPSKTAIRNTELQRIQNAYNMPYFSYPGERVTGMQPETIESMNRAGALNPKYKDVYHNDRKAIERHAINNSLPDQVFNAIPEAVDPLMKNLNYLTKQQLKKQSKEIAGKHVRLGSYGSGSHKAETERSMRDILNRIRQEREGALTGVAKGETSLATRREQTGLSKHKMMNLLGTQEFGNILDRNKELNKLGWDKRSNKQATENEALKNWYAQMQHSMAGTDTAGYENLAKQYDTNMQALFNRPQNYSDNVKSLNQYKNNTRQSLGDVTSRRQLEEWEEQQRRALMNGGYDPQYGSSQNNLRSQAYALAKATPVY